jgi:hypothetical protein
MSVLHDSAPQSDHCWILKYHSPTRRCHVMGFVMVRASSSSNEFQGRRRAWIATRNEIIRPQHTATCQPWKTQTRLRSETFVDGQDLVGAEYIETLRAKHCSLIMSALISGRLTIDGPMAARGEASPNDHLFHLES